jgi:hypothetical protein
MNAATLIDRARADFTEMPRLELTLAQAARLWNAGILECLQAVDALVASGFLMWTVRRTIVRTARAGAADRPYIGVQATPIDVKAV